MAKTPLSQLKTLLKSNRDVNRRVVELLALVPKLPDQAIDLMDDALADADPLMQVAIMDAYYEMTGDGYHESDLESMLNKAKRMGDQGEQLYMAARVALGHINGLAMDRLDEWGDGQLKITATARRRRRRISRAAADDEITIIIHGTWAADEDWWRPGGDFFEYAKKDLKRPDIYGKPDQFKWSGKNRDNKRRQAATELNKWLRDHPSREVNVFAHSHGANVAMLATHHDLNIDRLVMLSPPVRRDYFAKWSNVGEAFNIQASFDPVVAIAKGGQWFNLSQVKEKRMAASGHSSSHESRVWRAEGLRAFVGIPW